MLFRGLLVQTLRAMVRGAYASLSLPQNADAEEAAVSYAFMEWRMMREPYRLAYALALLTFRAYASIRYARQLERLTHAEIANLLDTWLKAPISPPGDFVRAVTLFFLMSSFDHRSTWRHLSLADREKYEQALRIYHDLATI